MSDYGFIINECKKAHYGNWEEQTFDACVQRLENLSRQELVHLYGTRWLDSGDQFKKAIGQVLFKQKIEEHRQMISSSSIEELGKMLTEKGGNNVKWAREELKRRYQEEGHDNQKLIISFFVNGVTKQDQKWGEARMPKAEV